DFTEGFKEKGFLPEAFINMLAMLGWNDGTTQEIFTLDELIDKFSMDRVHRAGAKFDYEKAKWFNQEWIKKLDPDDLCKRVAMSLTSKGLNVPDVNYLKKVTELVKERCTLLSDFYDQVLYFFKTPETLDLESIKPKWNSEKAVFFDDYIQWLSAQTAWNSQDLETGFKNLAIQKNIKPGELQLPFRIMLVGAKFGPAVFQIAEMIGAEETVKRIKNALILLHA
ncbi:MAG TPA: glutamate--tRNA ligase family protein, partial [Ferruginibacter sp.]|nr:glutamate--tRNA ligase family protein [Ferruginibacter sp.]